MAFLKHTEHFGMINELAVRIDAKKKALGAHALSREEQVIDSIWTAIGALENGSFQYFSECDLNAGRVAQAYQEIGMQDVAELFIRADRALQKVANKPWTERCKLLMQEEVALDRLATDVLKHTCEGEKKLFDYLNKNRAAFSW